eukprot:3551448-Pleurochrysis_carterae.AAC.4
MERNDDSEGRVNARDASWRARNLGSDAAVACLRVGAAAACLRVDAAAAGCWKAGWVGRAVEGGRKCEDGEVQRAGFAVTTVGV